MDRNVHADLPFSEDAFIDADITGAINVDIREVLYNTTEYWNSNPEIIAAKGIIYIYSDYKTIDDKIIPGIKVGDGSSYLIDIPFSDIEVELKADKVTTYTKTEVNTALSLKADKSNTYTKTEVNTALNDKADKSTTYTKTEVDTALNNKADKINTYTKTQIDAALNLKADTSDVTASLALKADKATTYTKTDVDTALALKSDKSYVDDGFRTLNNELRNKVNKSEFLNELATKADKATTYTKEQVDNIISNLPDPMIFKGTLGVNGTISDLPVASSDNDGYTYKVITDGTYQGIAAKVGDVFTSNGVEWVLIPSGDDVEDTWRTIKVNGTEVLNSAISSGSVDFVEGDNIEIIFNSTGHTILFKTKNIYTKTEVDNALSEKANTTDVNYALDLKADKSNTYTKTEVNNALSAKADKDGTYEDMTVGTAMKLVATRHTTDTAPYLFRQSGGDNNTYVGTEETDKLVGASAVVNQLVQNGNFADTSVWGATNVTQSAANNVMTITKAAAVGYGTGFLYQRIQMYADHKYLQMCDYRNNSNTTRIRLFDQSSADIMISDTNWHTLARIIEKGSTEDTVLMIWNMSRNDTEPQVLEVRNCFMVDLTAMFGTAIADYVYSLEQATAGSGIAYLRKYGFFTKDYYPYTANALQSVNTSAHITTGINRWDEEWEQGTFDSSTGEKKPFSNYWRSKNRIAVLPNTTYYAATSNDSIYRFYYDISGNYIGSANGVSNQTFTTPNGAYYLNIVDVTRNSYDSSSTPVSINYPSTVTTYNPYVKHEYALPNIDLRGLYKLDASNNLYAVGDTLEGDGTLTRKYGIVDLGTLNYSEISMSNNRVAYRALPSAFPSLPYIDKDAPTMLCPKYTSTYQTASAWGYDVCVLTESSVVLGNGFSVIVQSGTYTDVTAFKTAMSGVYLIYELATPTTESSVGFTNPQIVDKYGTEEYTDERNFPLPVGHETDYPLDSEMPLPVPPITAGTYNLQLTVDASGNETYSWAT